MGSMKKQGSLLANATIVIVIAACLMPISLAEEHFYPFNYISFDVEKPPSVFYAFNNISFDVDKPPAMLYAFNNMTMTVGNVTNIPPAYSNFSSDRSTTNILSVSDLSEVYNLTLAGSMGKIQFPSGYRVNTNGEDYDSNVVIGDCFISVNSEELDYSFNASALLTINNTDGHCGDNRVYTAEGTFTSADQIRTQDTRCRFCNVIEDMPHYVKFGVPHFTGYAIGSNSNLTIYDEFEGALVNIGIDIDFYAEYRNRTSGYMILGADCQIEFDDDPGTKHQMDYDGDTYNYTKAGGFSSNALHTWNVTCNATGYNWLDTQDDVLVSPNAIPEFSTSAVVLTIAILAMSIALSRKL